MQSHSLSCTFCKRSEHEVEKLVAGPGGYICDRCTELAHAIIHEGEPPARPPDSVRLRGTNALRRLSSWIGRRGGHRARTRSRPVLAVAMRV